MKGYLKNEIKKQSISSLCFVLIITVVSSILYIALCVSNVEHIIINLTDNLDYILPFIILGVVFKNFSYMNNKEELENIFSLPVTQREVFYFKYFVSLIEITLIFTLLLLITIPIFHIIQPNGNIYFDKDYYFLSLVIKYIFCYLLLNFFLYFYSKGNSFVHSICIILIGIFATTTIGFIILYIFEIFHVNGLSTLYVLPVSAFELISIISNRYIYNIHLTQTTLLEMILLSLFTLSSLFFTYRLHYKKYKISIENQGEVYISKMKIITLLTMSIISILLNAILIQDFDVTIAIIFLVNIMYYIIHSSFASRFKPTTKEWIIYFILFTFAVVIGLIL